MRVELVYTPDCPLVADTRVVLQRCLDRLGLQTPITDIQAALPSPSLLVDGVDVMGDPVTSAATCRLDVPTEDDIMAALRESADHGDEHCVSNDG